MTLTDFLLARYAEDEAVAREASRHYQEPIVEGGEHWRWECRDDEVVVPNFDMEFMQCSHEDWSMSLRSVEEYPYRSIPGVGPSIHLSLESELSPVVAAHITRHDPARVLADIAAKRAVVELHGPTRDNRAFSMRETPEQSCSVCVMAHADMDCENEPWPCPTLRALALPYRDHPEFEAG